MPQQIRGNILTFQENPDFNWVLSLLELRLFVSFLHFGQMLYLAAVLV